MSRWRLRYSGLSRGGNLPHRVDDPRCGEVDGDISREGLSVEVSTQIHELFDAAAEAVGGCKLERRAFLLPYRVQQVRSSFHYDFYSVNILLFDGILQDVKLPP